MPTNVQPNRQNFYNAFFSITVVLLAAYVTQHFFLPVLWAAILATATWPLYLRINRLAGGRNLIASLAVTLIVAAVFIVPVILVIAEASRQAPTVAHLVSTANERGIATPELFARIPLAGRYLHDWWSNTLAQPHGLSHLFSGRDARSLSSAGEMLKIFGVHVFHGLVAFGFAIVCLFFFYLDGRALRRQINAIGVQCLGPQRWRRYASSIPLAISSTVNGLVLVGLGEGLLLGISYAVAGLPAPVIWGAVTGALAIIPFGAPLAYLGAAVFLLATGDTTAAVGIAVFGSVILLVADHFIRPRIIGRATRMPFLLVLFGILGGVEAFGLIGLFIGPSVMALFVTLWREPVEAKDEATDAAKDEATDAAKVAGGEPVGPATL